MKRIKLKKKVCHQWIEVVFLMRKKAKKKAYTCISKVYRFPFKDHNMTPFSSCTRVSIM